MRPGLTVIWLADQQFLIVVMRCTNKARRVDTTPKVTIEAKKTSTNFHLSILSHIDCEWISFGTLKKQSRDAKERHAEPLTFQPVIFGVSRNSLQVC